MDYIYLSIIASLFVIIGYIPEITNILKTKTATIENLYIWFIWSCGSIFSISFCALNEEYYAMSTHVIIFTMNSSTFLLKLYYYKKPLLKYTLFNNFDKKPNINTDNNAVIFNPLNNNINNNNINNNNNKFVDIDIV
jgi:hypothetical protein